MRRISIGIHVQSAPDRLRDTLAFLRANTSADYRVMLLLDGADEPTTTALRELPPFEQSGTETPLGAAASFNRLTSQSDADVVVLLESGSLVGPRWLDHLLAALDSDPKNGLAGPSTNLSWNEQRLYPHSVATPEDVARTAEHAANRFGGETALLNPLYSLADFCYAVRREVIDRIGAADESYGPGPCWEMDYNVRAARAGFRGVWARAAYVHRLPFTARRAKEEARRFEPNKRRYQDKFCGARLRGEENGYRGHCRGDACPNFAPPDLIEIHLPRAGEQRGDTPATKAASVEPPPLLDHSPEAEHAYSVVHINVADPLVTCIMPTCDRQAFVSQAVRRYLAQDYVNTELVIVDDGADSIADLLPDDRRIRYLRVPTKMSVGAKRNFACANARGAYIAHWDDDDWYPASRIGEQLRAAVRSEADICGTSRLLFFDSDRDHAFEYIYAAPGKPWVAGTTLFYPKHFWETNNFAQIQVAEDSGFIWSKPRARVIDLADSAMCVAAIHRGNTSRKDTSGAFWHRTSFARVRDLLGDEINLYRLAANQPLVTCIMPTRNRREFVKLALRGFLKQDYANKELVIVDDGDDSIEDLIENSPLVRYVRILGRTSIGAKRNLACAQAKGEIIAHWDDDDWYSPDRLRYQVAPIVAGEADITGLENAFVVDLHTGQFWRTQPELHRRMFVGDVHGGTLVFRRQLLADGVSYPEVNLAEDAWLLRRSVSAGKRLVRLSNPGVFIYVRHGSNAWREFAPGRFIDPAGWQQISGPGTLPAGVLTSYKAALAGM